jgi:hypothetical protein
MRRVQAPSRDGVELPINHLKPAEQLEEGSR